MGMKIKISLVADGKRVKVPPLHPDERLPEMDANDVFSTGFAAHFDFRQIHQLTGAEALPLLREATERLGTDGVADYWVAIAGNVGMACARLASWSERYPEAVWMVED